MFVTNTHCYTARYDLNKDTWVVVIDEGRKKPKRCDDLSNYDGRRYSFWADNCSVMWMEHNAVLNTMHSSFLGHEKHDDNDDDGCVRWMSIDVRMKHPRCVWRSAAVS